MEGKHISEATVEAKKLIEDRRDGIIVPLVTPWPKLNKSIVGGFEWGTMSTIGGLSGAGKTAFIAQLYRNLHTLNSSQEFIILFFTFEMTAAKLILRDIIANTKIYREYLLSAMGNKITPQQIISVDAFLESIKDLPIYFIENTKTPEEYIQICRDYHVKFRKKIVAIGDHSLLFEGINEDNDRGMLVRLSKQIMKVKREEWSMHFLLSQLNRDIEQAVRRIPNSPMNYPDKSCLFASDALYQASDYVIIIHRPYLLKFVGDTYGPDKLSSNIEDTYLHIIKQREGVPAILKMKANFREMKIIDE
jgi:replicative DNA helicase